MNTLTWHLAGCLLLTHFPRLLVRSRQIGCWVTFSSADEKQTQCWKFRAFSNVWELRIYALLLQGNIIQLSICVGHKHQSVVDWVKNRTPSNIYLFLSGHFHKRNNVAMTVLTVQNSELLPNKTPLLSSACTKTIVLNLHLCSDQQPSLLHWSTTQRERGKWQWKGCHCSLAHYTQWLSAYVMERSCCIWAGLLQ